MSRLRTIRSVSLSTLALLATLALGACSSSPTDLNDSFVQQDSTAHANRIQGGWRMH